LYTGLRHQKTPQSDSVEEDQADYILPVGAKPGEQKPEQKPGSV
jgi:hypothetical protein